MGPSVLLYGCLAWGVGIAVFFVAGWVMAIVAGLAVAASTKVLVDLVASSRISADARLAADKAVDAFTNSYPDYNLSSVALRAIEDDRYVYSIRYEAPNQLSKPQARCYFAVSRGTDTDVVELDKSDWWPRGLK